MAGWQNVVAPTTGTEISDVTFGGTVATNMSDSGWIPVTNFVNSWENVAGYTTQYRLIGNMVRLQGCIQGGTSGTTAFTLPVAFIPNDNGPQFLCATQGGLAYAAISIGTNSSGTPGALAASGAGVSSYTYLSGIKFYVD